MWRCTRSAREEPAFGELTASSGLGPISPRRHSAVNEAAERGGRTRGLQPQKCTRAPKRPRSAEVSQGSHTEAVAPHPSLRLRPSSMTPSRMPTCSCNSLSLLVTTQPSSEALSVALAHTHPWCPTVRCWWLFSPSQQRAVPAPLPQDTPSKSRGSGPLTATPSGTQISCKQQTSPWVEPSTSRPGWKTLDPGGHAMKVSFLCIQGTKHHWQDQAALTWTSCPEELAQRKKHFKG